MVSGVDHSSPHTRRYFHLPKSPANMKALFSAHAEVFPAESPLSMTVETLLRTRGGISDVLMWGSNGEHSSPHTRRYFPPASIPGAQVGLFSAHAEVFPRFMSIPVPNGSLLRTRGGISLGSALIAMVSASSPHTRRYFLVWDGSTAWHALFSAHAEVFPANAPYDDSYPPVLRTRGGISWSVTPVAHRRGSSPHTRRYFPDA